MNPLSTARGGLNKQGQLYYIFVCRATLTFKILEPNSVTKIYKTIVFYVSIMWCYKQVHKTMAMYLRSWSIALSSLVVEISTEVYTCCYSRSTLQWTSQSEINQHSKGYVITVLCSSYILGEFQRWRTRGSQCCYCCLQITALHRKLSHHISGNLQPLGTSYTLQSPEFKKQFFSLHVFSDVTERFIIHRQYT